MPIQPSAVTTIPDLYLIDNHDVVKGWLNLRTSTSYTLWYNGTTWR